MSGQIEVLSHTADTGIAVVADTPGELFEWAARGMWSLSYDLDALRPTATTTVGAQAATLDDLLVDLLSELIVIAEATDVVPCRFGRVELDDAGVTMVVSTAPVATAALVGPPIKAVTYHELRVGRRPNGAWAAQIVFDV